MLCSQIVDLAEEAIIAVNRKQEIIIYNESARKMFGYDTADILGLPLDQLLPVRFRLQHRLRIEEFGRSDANTRHMGQRSRQIYGRRKDGSEFVASVQIMKLDGVEGAEYAAVVRDISQTRHTEEELLRLAATDPLTGAFNRREFTARADREAVRAQRYHHPLSILMFDLDHFKHLNDSYGHAAGDKALQWFVTQCCNTLRNVDIFGRWGGEEFVALLPETNADNALVIAERLREIVANNVMHFNGHEISFTVSIGLTQYRDNEISVEMPLGRADSAVYEAKKKGRNRTVVFRN